MRLDSDLSSSLGKFSMGVARFFNEAVCVHCTPNAELIFSLSAALEADPSGIVEGLCPADHSVAVSGANPGSPS